MAYKNRRMIMLDVMKKKQQEKEELKDYFENGEGKDLMKLVEDKHKEAGKKKDTPEAFIPEEWL